MSDVVMLLVELFFVLSKIYYYKQHKLHEWSYGLDNLYVWSLIFYNSDMIRMV